MPTKLFRGAFWEDLHCVDGIRRGADHEVGPSAYLHLERLGELWVNSAMRWCGGAVVYAAKSVRWGFVVGPVVRISYGGSCLLDRNSSSG